MAEAILLRNLPEGLGEVYVWKKYEVVENVSYKWNRWNVVSTTTYKWNKWNIETVNKYEAYTYNHITNFIKSQGQYWPCYVGWSLDADSGTFWFTGNPFEVLIARGDELLSSYVITYEKSAQGANGYGTGFYTNFSVNNAIEPDSYGFPYYHADWIKSRSVSTSIKGSVSYGQVSSTSSSAYPSNGESGSYWYESAGSYTSYSKGSTQYSDVTSTDPNAYPNGSYSGSYWYDNKQEVITYSIGSYIEDVFSTNPQRYPTNGMDGAYWYVLQS